MFEIIAIYQIIILMHRHSGSDYFIKEKVTKIRIGPPLHHPLNNKDMIITIMHRLVLYQSIVTKIKIIIFLFIIIYLLLNLTFFQSKSKIII